MDTGSILEYVVDKNQVPPIDQKRIVAFINHFVMSTADFLNKFAVNCETKFVDFESKLQKVEASMAILESKLASIPELDFTIIPKENTLNERIIEPVPSSDTVDNLPITDTNNGNDIAEPNNTDASSSPAKGVKASEDIRYIKYFKMLQFGVPMPAVKLKMDADGLDSHMIDDPNRILDDGVRQNNEPAD